MKCLKCNDAEYVTIESERCPKCGDSIFTHSQSVRLDEMRRGISQPKTEIGWLIELITPPGTNVDWWKGNGWTPEASDAIRFSRKEDAEEMLRYLRTKEPICAPWGKISTTEHMFYIA
jgi:hypothetical protein